MAGAGINLVALASAVLRLVRARLAIALSGLALFALGVWRYVW